MKKFFSLLLVLLLGLALAACKKDDNKKDDAKPPVLSGLTGVILEPGAEFDPLDGVTATDAKDGDLTDKIEVSGEVDTDKSGTYELTYTVKNSAGKSATGKRTIIVAAFANGEFDFKFATSELRNTFFAAAERYLLNTMNGGIPVFANAGFSIYSNRMQLPVDEYIPVMGFGTIFSTMSEDDSTVLMEDGKYGKAGEYTYRAAFSDNPTTFNHWIYDDSVSSDLLTNVLDALFVFEFNEDKTGFALNPSMAAEDPIAVDSRDVNGIEVSKTWRIKIREGLKWFYHPDVDTSNFPEGHDKIDANDFVETFKLAIENSWFRAISGGGHFWATSQEIVNAKAFHEGEADWEDVGLKVIDDHTIEFQFVNDMSDWNVKYWLGSFVMTPINFALYEIHGDRYGTTPQSTAYTGPYYLDYYEADVVLRLKKNPNYHSPDKYFFDGIYHPIIKEDLLRFEAFKNGLLDAASVPTSYYEEVKDDVRLRRVPGSTTFRININGFGTKENLNKTFPDTDYTPKPILANANFRRAMYFAIDRQRLAEDVLKVSQAQMYHFSSAYLVDPASGIPFRESEEAKLVDVGLSAGTHGFNPDLAQAYFKAAIDELVSEGVYKSGDTIELELRIFADSDSQEKFGAFIKEEFEKYFNDEDRNIKVTVKVTPTKFPDIYYDYMMTGNFDLAIGGISGSTLDAAGFLEVYNTDNRGGFTINWGFDTSTPDILVSYEDPETGETKHEMWSFDAIQRALNGPVKVENGREAD